ncbi:heterokaryon incompatibility protein-domain-containing protein [Paraphoma chrysanthemicola]|nr:heterokaryon incompatibility protein-domain-containing protein [Paraphoma chrysanthemicola]
MYRPNGKDFTDQDKLELCNFCLHVTQWLANPDITRRPRKFSREPEQETCEFCQWMTTLLAKGTSVPSAVGHTINLRHLHVTCETSSRKEDRDRVCFAHIYPGGHNAVLRFALWADEDSPAAAALVCRPPICGPDMSSACDLAQVWLADCSTHHPKCNTKDAALLPTRVLVLSSSFGKLSVRLMESKGRRGQYVALSHCWGPLEKQPLRTTQENYNLHLSTIPLEQLPKTFRDVVLLAHGIGIAYVWIDSLCIIQGDAQDWEAEAKAMGRVYQDAKIVISASDAKDSSEGLFVTERVVENVKRVPFIQGGETKGTFYVALLPTGMNFPNNGILNNRAWCLQEWYLARRTIMFMRGSIWWKCENSEQGLSERGHASHLGLEEKHSWLTLLRTYTERSLTYSSDRIEAIRGVVAQLQQSRCDRFLEQYGVWEDQLLEQLLWRHDEEYSDAQSLNLPSWSWAATGGNKIWCPDFHLEAHTYVSENVRVTSAGSLRASGHLTTATMSRRTVSMPLRRPGSFSLYERAINSKRCHYIWDTDPGKPILGIADFDHGNPVDDFRIWIATSTERKGRYAPCDDGDVRCVTPLSIWYSLRRLMMSVYMP